MNPVIVTSFMVIATGVSQAYKCRSLPKVEMEVAGLSTDFRFDKAENFTESKLKVIYEWRVINYNTKELIESGFDGFAYKFAPREFHWDFEITFYSEIHDYGDKVCTMSTENVWSRDSEVPCQLPCRDSFPPICNDSAVCTMLAMGYKTIPSNTTKLEFIADFGQKYDIHIIPYSNWKIGYGEVATGLGVVKYCKDELIQRQNVTHDQAHVYCDKVSMFSGKEEFFVFSGPVSHFEKYDVTVDFKKNRAKVSFRWKKPYDYHPNVTLQKYLIAHDEVRPTVQNLSESEYDVFTIENVTIGESRSLQIIPVLYFDEHLSETAVVHGAYISETYMVEDFDACSEDNAVGGRYCDVAANCTDLPAEANVSAVCTCPSGFAGNGISNKWPEGNGCTDQSSRTSSVVVGISCAIVIIAIIVFIAICIKSRSSNRRKILREEEAY